MISTALPVQASAGPSYGSAVYVTGRNCGAKLATQACAGKGTTLVYEDWEGGPNKGVSVSDQDENGNAAMSDISFGAGALPVIRQSDSAAADLRVNVNAFAFNSFTYTGAAASELSYGGNLHIVDSSGAPLANSSLAGGAGYFGWVAIWDPSLVSDFLGPMDMVNLGYGNYDCSTPGVLAFGGASGDLSGGEQSIGMTTSSCSGGTFMINPGQTVLAVAFLQTPANRGGWVDASHTFRVAYGSDLTPDVVANLVAQMTPGVAGVPEPATWSILLAGFGLMGAVARGRRRMARAA